jgi:hypothetical protein
MMMSWLQDAAVTAVALWAGWIVFRRVAGFVRPKGTAPGCANCPTGASARPAAADEHPLVFIKSPRR